jgi:hypothetical protein
MRYQHEIPVKGAPNCYLGFGESSWDDKTPVVKLGWRDKKGNRSRPGGEIWMGALLQVITEAIRLDYITPKQAIQAVAKGMK